MYVTQTLTQFELGADSILPLPMKLCLCLNVSYIQALWIKQDTKPVWCKYFLGWCLFCWRKLYFWEILHGTVDSRKYGWVRDTVWEWGQMELTYCFLCSCCTPCGAKNQTRKKKYFSFLNTDLFQVSLWFPLNNDSNMANALGRRCSIPVYKGEMEMERAQVVRELALGNCVL